MGVRMQLCIFQLEGNKAGKLNEYIGEYLIRGEKDGYT
ncbi:hypothetical protein BC03BB108_4913 [Bacillus cereus 03BB108]|nr:hypothetical protein BC03BB108_4913 [Bacillus cereus 03BB108]